VCEITIRYLCIFQVFEKLGEDETPSDQFKEWLEFRNLSAYLYGALNLPMLLFEHWKRQSVFFCWQQQAYISLLKWNLWHVHMYICTYVHMYVAWTFCPSMFFNAVKCILNERILDMALVVMAGAVAIPSNCRTKDHWFESLPVIYMIWFEMPVLTEGIFWSRTFKFKQTRLYRLKVYKKSIEKRHFGRLWGKSSLRKNVFRTNVYKTEFLDKRLSCGSLSN
jgi:hypothetical protein